MKLDRPKFENFKPREFPSREQFDSVELKLDGWWGQLLLKDRAWYLFSRSGDLKQSGELEDSWEPTILHGEYLYGTEWSKAHPELYGTLVTFGVQHAPEFISSPFVNKDERNFLLDMESYLNDNEVLRGVSVVEQWSIEEAPRLWEEYVVGQGYEGLVFKNSKAPWGSPFGRMKAMFTMDYVCLGFIPSDSDTYAGWGVASIIGGLYVNGELTRICKVSGMTNEQRKEFYDHPDKYVGKVFEAEGKKITAKGALRHPNFLRWREDKLPEECIYKGG